MGPYPKTSLVNNSLKSQALPGRDCVVVNENLAGVIEAMKSFTTVQTVAEDGVRTITLNRPDALNALNKALGADLRAALDLAAHDEKVRCVVLTGAGRAFCAGQDLRELDAHRDARTGEPATDFVALLNQRYNLIISRIQALEKPVIAAVNGVAAGAGFSLALGGRPTDQRP